MENIFNFEFLKMTAVMTSELVEEFFNEHWKFQRPS